MKEENCGTCHLKQIRVMQGLLILQSAKSVGLRPITAVSRVVRGGGAIYFMIQKYTCTYIHE